MILGNDEMSNEYKGAVLRDIYTTISIARLGIEFGVAQGAEQTKCTLLGADRIMGQAFGHVFDEEESQRRTCTHFLSLKRGTGRSDVFQG